MKNYFFLVGSDTDLTVLVHFSYHIVPKLSTLFVHNSGQGPHNSGQNLHNAGKGAYFRNYTAFPTYYYYLLISISYKFKKF
jgi:hypothetical protein